MPQPTVKLLGVATISLLILIVSFFSLAGLPQTAEASPPPQYYRLVNLIENGDFEQNPTSDVATHWHPYHNGQARYGWYAERWAEAVHSGSQSQLLEIHYVDNYAPDRVIAIHQSMPVIPHAVYSLTIHALMRTDAPVEDRNFGEYGMDWGIDFTGAGKYHRVKEWHEMPLTEQHRLGSNAPEEHDNDRLYFERITATVYVPYEVHQISLFIRGVKKEPTGTEVNFNIDDVSLIGTWPVITAPETITETAVGSVEPAEAVPAIASIGGGGDSPAVIPAASGKKLPDAGAVLPPAIPRILFILSGLVLIILVVSAINSLTIGQK